MAADGEPRPASRHLAATISGCLLALARGALASAAVAPNFVLVVADDLGYGDLGCYESADIRTPSIDRMAAEGVRLTEFYTPAPTCSPARAALLTGRHPLRTGLTRVLIPKEKWGLPHAEVTLAEHLGAAGYATACIGKWHLGGRRPYRPQRHGFDSFYGVLFSNNMVWLKSVQWPRFELIDGYKAIESPAQTALLTRRYTERALRFLREQRDRPFLLYLAYTMPHVPVAAAPPFAGRSPLGPYGDAVEELDHHVGQLLRELARLGLDRDTFVFFTSDNGPWLGDEAVRGGSTGGLRGFKGTTWEGGLRIPFIARAPGRLPSGAVRDGTATLLDLFPTIAGAAGEPLPPNRAYDGRDILPLLRGEDPGPARNLYFSNRRYVNAVRSGPWKLHVYERALGPKGRPRKPRKVDPPQLYRLDEDPAEARDVAALYPEVAARLARSADRFAAGIEPTMRLPSYFLSIVRGLLTLAPPRRPQAPGPPATEGRTSGGGAQAASAEPGSPP